MAKSRIPQPTSDTDPISTAIETLEDLTERLLAGTYSDLDNDGWSALAMGAVDEIATAIAALRYASGKVIEGKTRGE